MPLNFEQIKSNQVPPAPYRDVPVEQWGGEIRLKRFRPIEKLNALRMCRKLKEEGSDEAASLEVAADLIAMAVVDENDAPQFASDEGREFLLEQDLDLLHRLVNEIFALNGINVEAQDAELEEAKKN